MTDARRQEQEPDQVATGPGPSSEPQQEPDQVVTRPDPSSEPQGARDQVATGPGPSSEPQQAPDPDAVGAWPEGDEERAAMPDQRVAQESAGLEEGDPVEPEASAAEEDPRSREELLAALREAEGQRDEYLDGAQRARAEFENYRKRTMREGASQREAGRAEVVEGLLEVVDDLDRTLEAAAGSEDASLARGVQLVAEKLVATLQGAGLERVDATGVAFDPNRHEAVQQRAADEPREEPVVTEVLRPGYALGEKVLRAAMVVVEQ